MALRRLLAIVYYSLYSPLWRLVYGLILIVIGIILGLTSHQAIYREAPNGQYEIMALESGKIDFYNRDNGQNYVIYPDDFESLPEKNAFLAGTHTFPSIRYSSETTYIKIRLKDGSSISGDAYHIEKFTMSDTDGGQQQIFSSYEYQQNPGGYYQNNWPSGVVLIAAGGAVLLFTLFLSPLRTQLFNFRKPIQSETIPQEQPFISD